MSACERCQLAVQPFESWTSVFFKEVEGSGMAVWLRVLDLKFSTALLSGVIHSSPEFNSSTALVA